MYEIFEIGIVTVRTFNQESGNMSLTLYDLNGRKNGSYEEQNIKKKTLTLVRDGVACPGFVKVKV